MQKKRVERIDSEKQIENLIDQYGNLIFSICFNITKNYFDAEDLAQETFLIAYKNLENFDGQNEKAWLAKIATNKCLDYIKSAKRRIIPTSDDYFQDLSTTSTPESILLEDEVNTKLEKICKNLKPPYDEIATDYFCKELTVADISKKSGKNIKTIQTQIYRAKSLLKKLWREEF